MSFEFEAVRPTDGAVVRGRLESQTREDALSVLSERGLLATRVLEVRAPNQRSLPSVAQAIAFRSLASLVEAGVPLGQAIETTCQVTAGEIRESLERVSALVREGKSFGAALKQQRGLSAVAVGMVQAAEHAGELGTGLERAADELESRAEMAGRIRAALAYPAILLTVGSLSIAGILLLVVPKFAALLGDVRQTLPPLTRALLASSDLLNRHLAATLVGFCLFAMTLGVVIRRHRHRLHAWSYQIPVIGPIRLSLATSRAASTLARLLATGTPALRALRIAEESVGDSVLAERLARAGRRVSEGASISAALRSERALSPLALQLAAIGDGAGRVPDLLARAAEMEARRGEQRIRTAVALLEPALILSFAAAVALVAAALLQAVYSIRPSGL